MDFRLLFPALKTTPGLASGFVSFAFHPEFGTNGLFYTAHIENVGATPPNLGPALPATIIQHAILSEWTATDPALNAFAGTHRELMRIASTYVFHNLQEIAFNPNAEPSDDDYGLLYICNGEYGSVTLGAPGQLQRLDTPYGAMLRIDPTGGPFMRGGTTFHYGIPSSNPFANDPDPTVLGEIYAYGFRNSHRITWDSKGNPPGPFASDIGEHNGEEINRLIPGKNYGWPVREGNRALDTIVDPWATFSLPGDDASYDFTYPVAWYDHQEGLAIAGGLVYRADLITHLEGKFIFGDIQSGRLLYSKVADLLAADDGDPTTMAPIYELGILHEGSSKTLLEIVADELGLQSVNRVDLRFGVDGQDQIYVTTKQDGVIRKLLPAPEPAPALLMTVGCAGLAALSARCRASDRRRS
jgi:hypothetical protein